MRSEFKQSPRGRLRGRPLCGAKTRAGGSLQGQSKAWQSPLPLSRRQIDRPKDTSWSRSNCGGPAPTMALLSSATRARHVSKSEAGEEAPGETSLQLIVATGDSVTPSEPRSDKFARTGDDCERPQVQDRPVGELSRS